MGTFVLVPGFWLGAWAWDAVAARLREDGHTVHAVTLAGLAERAGEAGPGVDVDAHIADVAGLIEREDLRDVVLVAHSGATMPVTGVADRMPERLARVVYVDTAPLPDGWAQLDFLGPEARAAVEAQVREEGDGWRLPPPFPASAAEVPEEEAAQYAGLDDALLALLRERATPQPFGTSTQPLRRPGPVPATPKTMVMCTMPGAAVEQMVASGAPAFAMLAGPEWDFRELPTGHWPMLSRPSDLAALLTGL